MLLTASKLRGTGVASAVHVIIALFAAKQTAALADRNVQEPIAKQISEKT